MNNKKRFLEKVSKLSSLKNNRLAVIFAHNEIDLSKKDKILEILAPYYIFHEHQTSPNIIDVVNEEDTIWKEWEGLDLRINNLRLKSIRAFPNQDKPYGINFGNKENSPQSMVFLGGNGVGKSSVFNTLEYLYCNKIGEAQLRTSVIKNENDYYQAYLQHFNLNYSSCFAEVNTVSRKITLEKPIPQKIRNKINPNTFFISENDINTNGKLDYDYDSENSFHSLVAKSLGLSEVIDFKKNISDFLSYRRMSENNKITALEKTIANEMILIVNRENSLQEKKELLKQLEQQTSGDYDTSWYVHLRQVISSALANDLNLKINLNWLRESNNNFMSKYFELLSHGEGYSSINEVQFLHLGRELLKKSEDCPFCESSSQSKETLTSQIEQRITKAEHVNNVSNELRVASNVFMEQLRSLFNQVANFKSNIKKELDAISSVDSLHIVSTRENALLNSIDYILKNSYFLIFNKKDQSNLDGYDLYNYIYKFITEEYNQMLLDLDDLQQNAMDLLQIREKVINHAKNNMEKDSESYTKFERLVVLKRDALEIEKYVSSSKEAINAHEMELSQLRSKVVLHDEIKENMREYYEQLRGEIAKEVKEAYLPIKGTIESVLKKYLENEHSDIDLEISLKNDYSEESTAQFLVAKIIPKNKEFEELSVSKYFNTFHFRLFSTMVSIAVAIAMRNNTRINIPLIIDDIFHASDFRNKAIVERFVINVFESFEEYSKLPLQLIIFTHDQVIFESILHAFSVSKIENVLFAKMFPCKNAVENENFFNIAYQIPALSYYPNVVRPLLAGGR